MLSNNQIKHIRSLSRKKNRILHQEFIIEGEKIVTELINQNQDDSSIKWKIKKIFAYQEWLNKFQNNTNIKQYDIQVLNEGELDKISSLVTPNQVLALININDLEINFPEINMSLSLYLDDIQDPGNLGNIIRISDWFGIKNLFCSENSVDSYNPKVIQATMGSFCRVNVYNVNIRSIISNVENKFPVYGTFLEGENIYSTDLNSRGLIIFGNESKGINQELIKFIKQKLYIPAFPSITKETDSLNVSSAAAIICSEFRRRII